MLNVKKFLFTYCQDERRTSTMEYLDLTVEGIDENKEKKEFKLSDFKGKNIVLYFYPKDETPVCTEEAEKFNEYIEKFPDDTVIIGVSSDDTDSHLSFMEKLGLKFKLLCDKEHKLKEAIHKYVKEHLGHERITDRATVIINKDGEIVKVWNDVDVDGHAEEILEYIETMDDKNY